MRIFSRRTLRDFWEKHPDAAEALRAWHREAENADWSGPADVKARFSTASFVGNDRIVFNIGGNKYRLIVRIRYEFKAVYVLFIGTHPEYDRIDVGSL